MQVSVTERGTFKRCRQQWDYTSLQRQALTPIVPKSVFELGTLIHTSLEQWAVRPDVSLAELFKANAGISLTAIKERYLQQVGANISDMELGDYYDLFGLGTAMCENYQTFWKTPIPEGFKFVQPEQTVVVPIPRNDSLDEQHYLEGTFDGLLEDEAGRLWILEHKTYDKRPTDDNLRGNDQFLAYLWMLWRLTRTEGPFAGRVVGGIAYDGLWKRAVPPKGRTFDELFLRKTLTRPFAELMHFERTLPLEIEDMNNANIYRHIPWMGCADCHMKPLCDAEHRGEDANYIRRTMYAKREERQPITA